MKDTITAPCGCEYTDEQVRSLWGKYKGLLGGGRPREPNRCPCGLYTRETAARRGHKCKRKGKQK